MRLLYIPFILQALVIFMDEEFHKKRCLGIWERLGHPLDTITVLLPLMFSLLNPFTDTNSWTYFFMSFFSCLFITKNEFIRSTVCSPGEHWLHALLFILHPLVLLAAFFQWKNGNNDHVLIIQCLLTGLFLIYQIIRWSIPWKLMK